MPTSSWGSSLSYYYRQPVFHGVIEGACEGVLIAAVGTSFVVKFFNRRLRTPLNRVLCG